MKLPFRVLSARTNSHPRLSDGEHYSTGTLAADTISAEMWPNNKYTNNLPAISVVIGNNGTGKSRLLSSITRAFIDKNDNRKKRDKYYIFDHLNDIIDKSTHITTSGLAEDNSNIPQNIIAVSLTSFDKFPLERPNTNELDKFYHYIGMRDRMNRASVTALIYKCLEGIIQNRQSHPELTQVFNILGFNHYMDVRIKLDVSQSLETIIFDNEESFDINSNDSLNIHRVKRLISKDRVNIDDVRGALFEYKLASDSKSEINIHIDTANNKVDSPISYDRILLLRKIGVVRLLSITITKNDGTKIDLRAASSGQINMIMSFLAIASFIKERSLILIEEPETGLHPEWQDQYIELLLKIFGRYKNCHFIISSHSPMIISDTAKSNCFIYSLDSKSDIDVNVVGGESYDKILAKAFNLVSNSNLYLRQTIIEAVALLNDNDTIINKEKIKRFNELQKNLSLLVKNMNHQEPARIAADQIISMVLK